MTMFMSSPYYNPDYGYVPDVYLWQQWKPFFDREPLYGRKLHFPALERLTLDFSLWNLDKKALSRAAVKLKLDARR